MSVTHFLHIAGIQVVTSPDRIRTLLGSCVGVVLYDAEVKAGGAAHIMLPNSEICDGTPGKFADTGIDALLQNAIGAGCRRQRLKAKIAGGATLFGFDVDGSIGERNIQAVKERLAHHTIRLVAADLGGTRGRRILFDPKTGQVVVEFNGGGARVI